MLTRRLLVGVATAAVPLLVVACANRAPKPASNVNATVAETGTMIDVTDRHGAVVFALPGDVITLALRGNTTRYPKSQWSFRAPVTGNALTLKRHDVLTANDPRLQPGEFISEWAFKLERPDAVEVRLEYEQLGRRTPLDDFRIYLVSDRSDAATAPVLVLQPAPESQAPSPLALTGYARAFAGTVRYRLRDEASRVLADGFTTSVGSDPSARRAFAKAIAFAKPRTGRGTLEVFSSDAALGAEIDTVIIPVVFDPNLMAVEAYFTNDRLDPEVTCTKVFAVKRWVPKTAALARAALEQLLAGPTPEEQADGYRTSLPAGVKIQQLDIADGVAKADFGPTLERGVGGSCRVTAIRAQLEQTLRQFESVTSVVLSINNRTEDILQP